MWPAARALLLDQLAAAQRRPAEANREPGTVECLLLIHQLTPERTREAFVLAGTRWTRAPGTLLLVTDFPDLASLRALDQRLELLPARESWVRHVANLDYDEFLVGRLAEIVALYSPRVALGAGTASRDSVRAAHERLITSRVATT